MNGFTKEIYLIFILPHWYSGKLPFRKGRSFWLVDSRPTISPFSDIYSYSLPDKGSSLPLPTRARALARERPPSSPRTLTKSIFIITNFQADFACRQVAITRYIAYFQGIHIHKSPRGYTFINPLENAIFELKK